MDVRCEVLAELPRIDGLKYETAVCSDGFVELLRQVNIAEKKDKYALDVREEDQMDWDHS